MILIFILLSLAEAVRHWYLIERKHISPNKIFSFILRWVLSAIVIYFDPLPKWVTIPTYTIVDWYIHDYFLNTIRKVSPVWLLNNTGPVDIFQRNYPNMFVWFVWKTLALVGLVGGYFFNN